MAALIPNPVTVSTLLDRGPSTIAGHSWAEQAGTTAQIKYHNGADVTGPICMTVNLGASESVTEFYGVELEFLNGLYVEVIGTITGSVFNV